METVVLGGRFGSVKLGAYRYGEKKWDDYLIDVRESIENASEATRQQIGTVLKDANASLADMRGLQEQVVWALEGIGAELSVQTTVLRSIDSSLRSIATSLATPRDTQAAEFCIRGFNSLNNGWYEEADADFERAVELSPTSPYAHFGRGWLRFYGTKDNRKGIDLQAAKKQLALALKYSAGLPEPERAKALNDATLLLSKVLYCTSSEAALAGQTDAAASVLNEGLELLSNPPSFEAQYIRAKLLMIKGDSEAARRDLMDCADADRHFLFASVEDPDLSRLNLRASTLENLLSNPGANTKHALESLAKARSALKILESIAPEVQEQFYVEQQEKLKKLRACFPTLDNPKNWLKMSDLSEAAGNFLKALVPLLDSALYRLKERHDKLQARAAEERNDRPKLHFFANVFWLCILSFVAFYSILFLCHIAHWNGAAHYLASQPWYAPSAVGVPLGICSCWLFYKWDKQNHTERLLATKKEIDTLVKKMSAVNGAIGKAKRGV